jgi:hypothetical protein
MKKTLAKYILVFIAGLTILLLGPALISELQNTEIAADIHKIEKASDPYLYQYDTPTFDLFAGEEKDEPIFKITQSHRSLDFNVKLDQDAVTPTEKPAHETSLLNSSFVAKAAEEISVVNESTKPAIQYEKVTDSADFLIKPDQEKVTLSWELLSEQDPAI